jgi:hypothetical protein
MSSNRKKSLTPTSIAAQLSDVLVAPPSPSDSELIMSSQDAELELEIDSDSDDN